MSKYSSKKSMTAENRSKVIFGMSGRTLITLPCMYESRAFLSYFIWGALRKREQRWDLTLNRN